MNINLEKLKLGQRKNFLRQITIILESILFNLNEQELTGCIKKSLLHVVLSNYNLNNVNDVIVHIINWQKYIYLLYFFLEFCKELFLLYQVSLKFK